MRFDWCYRILSCDGRRTALPRKVMLLLVFLLDAIAFSFINRDCHPIPFKVLADRGHRIVNQLPDYFVVRQALSGLASMLGGDHLHCCKCNWVNPYAHCLFLSCHVISPIMSASAAFVKSATIDESASPVIYCNECNMANVRNDK